MAKETRTLTPAMKALLVALPEENTRLHARHARTVEALARRGLVVIGEGWVDLTAAGEREVRRAVPERAGGLWLATLETRSFDFSCYAASRQNAERLMRKAWDAHRRDYGGPDAVNMYVWDDLKDDVVYREIHLGVAYRDGEEVTR